MTHSTRLALVLTLAAWCLTLVLPQLDAPKWVADVPGARVAPPSLLGQTYIDDALHDEAYAEFLFSRYGEVVALSPARTTNSYTLVVYDFRTNSVSRHRAGLHDMVSPQLLAAAAGRLEDGALRVAMLFVSPRQARWVFLDLETKSTTWESMSRERAEALRGVQWRDDEFDMLFDDGERVRVSERGWPRKREDQPAPYVHDGEILWARPGEAGEWDRVVFEPDREALLYYDAAGGPGRVLDASASVAIRAFLEGIRSTDGNVTDALNPPLYAHLSRPTDASKLAQRFTLDAASTGAPRLTWVSIRQSGEDHVMDGPGATLSARVGPGAWSVSPSAREGFPSDTVVHLHRGSTRQRTAVINGWTPRNAWLTPIGPHTQVLLDASGRYALFTRGHVERIDVAPWYARLGRVLSGEAWALDRARLEENGDPRLLERLRLLGAPIALPLLLLLWPGGVLIGELNLARHRRRHESPRVAFLATDAGRRFSDVCLVLFALFAASFWEALVTL